MQRVLITTSGLGSRLGNLTKYTNKSLVKVGDQPAISRIVEIYPPNTEFVITLGHHGDLVRQFLTLCYPNHKFEFVTVDPYAGPGSSLLKSISFAYDFLQCPFIFHACDTILPNPPPPPNRNWMCVGNCTSSAMFRTVNVDGRNVTHINEKGESQFDFAYLGVAGIYDYNEFWSILQNTLQSHPHNSDLSDCHVLGQLLKLKNIEIEQTNKWWDIGSVDNLIKTQTDFPSKYTVLDKDDESIYFMTDSSVVKFFSNESICRGRVERAKHLSPLIPELIGNTKNFYSYKMADGILLADQLTERGVDNLLEWATDKLWTPVQVKPNEFKELCLSFYRTKTLERIKRYVDTVGEDTDRSINGIVVPQATSILETIDWDYLSDGLPTRFHGDFILDNILISDQQFTLLDWRQDFSGSTAVGDLYYDLAKLNHSMVFSHEIVSQGGFSIRDVNGTVWCDIFRSSHRCDCQQELHEQIITRGFNLKKVRILTALIWLNMAPLHVYPVNKFLYHFGKYHLWKELMRP